MSTEAVDVRSRVTAERRFYLAMAIAMFAAVYVGFAPTFYLRPFVEHRPAPPEAIFYVHGVFFSAWMILLIAQTSLVTAGRTDLHRKLGASGVVLACAMVVLGVFGALVAAGRPTGFFGVPVPALQFLAVPLFDMALFATFVALAVANRRDPQSHKRWMLLATVNLLTAGIARWPGLMPAGGPLAFFAITDLFIGALAVWDWRSQGRVHRVTRIGGIALVVSQPLRLAVSGTSAWLAFASWATALVN